MEKRSLAVLYPVAGMSSRFGGKMKWLIKVGPNGETLIEYSANQAIKSGFSKIIFIVSKKTYPFFKDLFKDNYRGASVFYAFQEFDPATRDKPWGTADALCCGLNLIDCPTVFCNGDDIYGGKTFEIIADHFNNNSTDVAVGYLLKNVLSNKGSVNRGLFQIKDNHVIDLKEIFNIEKSNLIEKGLKEDDLISMNIFGFLPETIMELNNQLIQFKEINRSSRTAECLLPNEVGNLVKRGLKMKIYPTPSLWYGVTNPEDEDVVREALRGEVKTRVDEIPVRTFYSYCKY